jgi:hypothetical protein
VATLTLQPDETDGVDTQIAKNGASANYNYGVGGSLLLNPDNDWRQYAMLKFDLSSIPSDAIISSAVLTLYLANAGGSGAYNVTVHRALTQWYEGAKNGATPDTGQDGSTWNYRNHNGSVVWGTGGGTPGGLSGTDFTATATATTSVGAINQSYTWDVLADVAAWVAGTATNYGWWLRHVTEYTWKSFVSSGGATSSQRPKLVVEYTVPGGAFQPFLHQMDGGIRT